jgi:peptidoglycan/LPS O-acetylase OafA/YrhL
VTRVYPLWWIFCSLMALYFWLTYGQPASPDLETSQTAMMAYVKSLLLWPQDALPILNVGWTLIYEVAFYVVFALLLLLPAKLRPIFLTVWAVGLLIKWAVAAPLGGVADSWATTLMDPLCLEFLMGAAAAYFIRRTTLSISMPLGFLALGIGLFGVALCLGATGVGLDFAQSRVLIFGLPAMLIVIGCVGCERADRFKAPALLGRIGDASYTLYLSHILVLLVLKRGAMAAGMFDGATPLSVTVFTVIGVSVSVVASLIIYRFVERPLLQVSRRLIPRA